MSMTLSMTAAEWLGVLGACLFALMMLLFTAGRLLVGQIEKRLDSRFATLDEQRKDGQSAWMDLFNEHTRHDEREFESIQASLVALTSELSRNYVRREELQDHLRDLRTRSQLLDEKLDRVLLAIGGIHGSP
jgi:predicted nuclease with TOPRIM domain